MNTPIEVVTETTTAVGKALTFKNIIVMMVLVVVVTLLISMVMRNEVTMYDDQGNVTGSGEIKPKLKIGITKK